MMLHLSLSVNPCYIQKHRSQLKAGPCHKMANNTCFKLAICYRLLYKAGWLSAQWHFPVLIKCQATVGQLVPVVILSPWQPPHQLCWCKIWVQRYYEAISSLHSLLKLLWKNKTKNKPSRMCEADRRVIQCSAAIEFLLLRFPLTGKGSQKDKHSI